MRILVVVAHPDDEVLGMGGTILKHTQKADTVKIVYLSTGIMSRRKSGYVSKESYDFNRREIPKMENEVRNLQNNAKKACKVLGVKKYEFFDFPDNEMDSLPLLKIIKIVEAEIKKVKPDRIYTNHFDDLNVDHRVVYNATLTACRPISSRVPELVCFEVPSSTEWNYPQSFNPNYFVNITNQLDKKIKAMKMYKNEIMKFPHPRSLENLKNVSLRWGSVSGNKAAEAFEIIRRIEK